MRTCKVISQLPSMTHLYNTYVEEAERLRRTLCDCKAACYQTAMYDTVIAILRDLTEVVEQMNIELFSVRDPLQHQECRKTLRSLRDWLSREEQELLWATRYDCRPVALVVTRDSDSVGRVTLSEREKSAALALVRMRTRG